MPSVITTLSGDLIDQQVDAIVIDWMPNLLALLKRFRSRQTRLVLQLAGREVTHELAKQWPLYNKAAHTTAGNLPFRGIIHVDSSGFTAFLSTENSIRCAVHYALGIAKEKQYKSIAFPLLGEGLRFILQHTMWHIMSDQCQRSPFPGAVYILFEKGKFEREAARAAEIKSREERKSIAIYFRKGILYFVPCADGGVCSVDHFSKRIQLDDTVSDREKGEAFWKAVNASGEKLPDHDWRDGPRPEMTAFLEETNIKTWATFTKHAFYVSATWNKTKKVLIFSPLKYEHGGYSGTKDGPDFEIPDDSSLEVIGETIETALNHCVGQGGKKKSEVVQKNEPSEESVCNAVCFGYKHCWIAVKSDDMKKVAAALGIKNPKEADWETGVEKSYQNHIFVTPPIGQWILAAGCQVSAPELESLSRTFGEAQSFGAHRGSDCHFWSKAVGGKIVRGFAVADGEVTEQGEPTPIERDLIDFDDEDFFLSIDEDTVMQVAADWSVDPMDLESREGIAVTGLLG